MKHSLTPGMAVSSNVRLVRPLSEGGMGTLWVADHLTLDTEVVVKFVHQRVERHTPEADQRFEREAKAAAKVKSPHVVQIFDYGRMSNGTAYIVMEKLEGESLANRLNRTGWLSMDQSAEVVRQMCKALHKAALLNVVHRDIKPDNIFLCPSDDGIFVKLVDFGVAKDGSPTTSAKLTNPGNLIGSVEYLCRDQVVRAREADSQTDLWALAVCAYEMLTGDVPFTGETTGSICVSIANANVVPPSELRRGVPAAVDAWFARALHREPEERFATPREFATAFGEAILGDRFEVDDDPSRDTPLPDAARRPGAPTLVGMPPDPATGPAALEATAVAPASSSQGVSANATHALTETLHSERPRPPRHSIDQLPFERRARWGLLAMSVAAALLGVAFVARQARFTPTHGEARAVSSEQREAPISARARARDPRPAPPADPPIDTPARTLNEESPGPSAPSAPLAQPTPSSPPQKAQNPDDNPSTTRPDYGF